MAGMVGKGIADEIMGKTADGKEIS